ncbi:hypothetical protein [Methylobacterium radiodurans]|uniref:hypothetical protein n=1 Tax=Methylobacterium radiodurans TaxID=2202828 RepID=UPI0013A5A48D|nr:hypothetical protein [Methylobacterium radiodurans]
MTAMTARRILTLIALVVPALGWTCREADRAVGQETASGQGRGADPDAVVFRHFL